MTSFCRRTVLCLAIVLGCVASVRTAGAAAETTCALIADGDARLVGQLAPLVQAKAQALPQTRWVERDEVDKVLAEQKLAAVLGPENARERIALGRLLKADVLVILRPSAATAGADAATEAGIDVVIAETRGGLRLQTRAVPVVPGAEAKSADAVAELIAQGVRKAREVVRAVCAVPPFVDKDLAYDYEHLKSAYARLIEQALLEQPGIVVVEIAEARAIAQEIAIGGGKVARPMPLYVLGEFRNTGTGEARRQSVRVAIKRGEQELEERASGDVAPADAVAFVRDSASRVTALLTKNAGGSGVDRPARAAGDLNVEAKQLSDRAAVHRRLADWEQAAALTEAALLLTPGDDELHRQAVIIYGNVTKSLSRSLDIDVAKRATAENVYRRAAPFFRGFEHLETFLRNAGELDQAQSKAFDEFMSSFGQTRSGPPAQKPEPWVRAIAECAARKRETQLRIAIMRTHMGRRDSSFWISGDLWGLSPAQQAELMWAYLDATKDMAGARRRAERLVSYGITDTDLDGAEGRALIARLSGCGHSELKAAAATLERVFEQHEKALLRVAREAESTTQPYIPKRNAIPTTGPAEVVFKPVRFFMANEKRNVEAIGGMFPAGDGLDFAWFGGWRLCVMKQKGVLRTIWSSKDTNPRLLSITFDGRYVWAAVQEGKGPPKVLVLDPVAERSWEVTPAAGLPLDADLGQAAAWREYYLQVAGVEPGVACVAGAFGRSWVAMVKFDPNSGPSAKVFHEAIEVSDEEDTQERRGKSVEFVPMYAVTIGDPKAKAADKRVLIGRTNQSYSRRYQPLVINPQTLEVDVLQDPGPWHDRTVKFWTVHDGAMYWAQMAMDRTPRAMQPNIYRIGMPDLKQTAVATHVYDGEKAYRDMLVFYGGRVHLLARDWWCADALDEPFHRLGGDIHNRYPPTEPPPPGIRVRDMNPRDTEQIMGLLESNHYGLLAQVRSNRPPGSTYQVIFPGR